MLRSGICGSCCWAQDTRAAYFVPLTLSFFLGRWIKFEEKVEDGGERWSMPHIPALPLHSLFELRTCLQKGTVLLDLDAHSVKEIIGTWET